MIAFQEINEADYKGDMTESEFNRRADEALAHIEKAIDDCGGDVECNRSGNVLEAEFDSGQKIIITPRCESGNLGRAKSGGFSLRPGRMAHG